MQVPETGTFSITARKMSAESGEEALAVLDACANGTRDFDVLCVEGAMLRGPNGTGRFHLMAGSAQPLTDWVQRLAARAKWVFAIGSCTAYGFKKLSDLVKSKPHVFTVEERSTSGSNSKVVYVRRTSSKSAH